jgi:hypothetical protein
MLITICFSAWIGMFQAANVAKAKQALASCFEETTVEMDDDTTFITKLESFDDRTTVKVVELDTSIFGCFYNYLVTVLLQNHCKWSVNNSDLSSIYIAISGDTKSMKTTAANIGGTKMGQTKMYDTSAEKNEGCEEKKDKTLTTAVKKVGMTTTVDNDNSLTVSKSILILFLCHTEHYIISLYLIILIRTQRV